LLEWGPSQVLDGLQKYSPPEKFSPGLGDLGIENRLKTKGKSPNLPIPAHIFAKRTSTVLVLKTGMDLFEWDKVIGAQILPPIRFKRNKMGQV
jgi:hypothetical protein